VGLDADREAAVTKSTGTLKLTSRRLRTVEILGPLPPNGRRPKLLLDRYATFRPSEVKAHCYSMKDRTALFLIDPGKDGDELLALLAKYPNAPARPVSSYGPDGWAVKI
jgi:hypothetical protein